MLYFGWLACDSRLIFPRLPERVIRQFGYTQTILSHLILCDPPPEPRIEMTAMFDDYFSHLVSEEAQSTIAESDWSYVDKYIK